MGREILRAEKRAGNAPATAVDLTIMLKLAVQPQFFTPGGFSGTITLIVSEATS